MSSALSRLPNQQYFLHLYEERLSIPRLQCIKQVIYCCPSIVDFQRIFDQVFYRLERLQTEYGGTERRENEYQTRDTLQSQLRNIILALLEQAYTRGITLDSAHVSTKLSEYLDKFIQEWNPQKQPQQQQNWRKAIQNGTDSLWTFMELLRFSVQNNKFIEEQRMETLLILLCLTTRRGDKTELMLVLTEIVQLTLPGYEQEAKLRVLRRAVEKADCVWLLHANSAKCCWGSLDLLTFTRTVDVRAYNRYIQKEAERMVKGRLINVIGDILEGASTSYIGEADLKRWLQERYPGAGSSRASSVMERLHYSIGALQCHRLLMAANELFFSQLDNQGIVQEAFRSADTLGPTLQIDDEPAGGTSDTQEQLMTSLAQRLAVLNVCEIWIKYRIICTKENFKDGHAKNILIGPLLTHQSRLNSFYDTTHYLLQQSASIIESPKRTAPADSQEHGGQSEPSPSRKRTKQQQEKPPPLDRPVDIDLTESD
eukprot:gb/GECG01005501.1/.p1 GENE.gb/GECG01005501.1/~~gb/GECG01005501.1/.p1  ORF type:complete len:484 (+),score=57.64 gb/GECG01005501.1/:1-1452(+)